MKTEKTTLRDDTRLGVLKRVGFRVRKCAIKKQAAEEYGGVFCREPRDLPSGKTVLEGVWYFPNELACRQAKKASYTLSQKRRNRVPRAKKVTVCLHCGKRIPNGTPPEVMKGYCGQCAVNTHDQANEEEQ